MATPKKTISTPKIIPDEIEVNFVVGIRSDGCYTVVEIEDGQTPADALDNTMYSASEHVGIHYFKVFLPRPNPLEPIILVPQVG